MTYLSSFLDIFSAKLRCVTLERLVESLFLQTLFQLQHDIFTHDEPLMPGNTLLERKSKK